MSEEQQAQPQLALERIYAKDISFEVPGAKVFTKEWQPELNINLSSNAEQIDASHYEVTLKVTVSAENAQETAFIAEVQQAGIFLMENISQEQLPQLLGAYCPSILFPFAREAINDVVTKGSFPQLLLAPINFDAAFAENMARLEQEQATGTA
ncbi:protein-export chaperone SecB [Alkanindiges sp. WGS2144]|uniref:protein-export chaperone SecB n=1 Tax=Alkanindiges sp. WGS2144 TaxID=3366808 RepID=UPI0037500474